MPFHLWLRHIAKDHIIDAHRRHRQAQRRSLDREQSLFNPGPGDSVFRFAFGGSAAVHSDGSAGLTRLAYSFELAAVGGTLFFGASDGTSNGLWRTDGTAAGTVRLAELAPSQLTAVNGTLFFTTDTGGLWKSDGTAAGTVRVAAVDPSGLTSGLTGLDGVLYFFLTGRFSFQPTALWRSDGSEAGTREVGNAVVSPQSVGVRNGSLFFLGTLVFDNVTRLYRYDAPRGIALVRTLPQGAGPLTAIYDQLLFGDRGGQLWRSDGTESGTTALQDFAINDVPAGFTRSGGYVFFAADGGDALGRELWALPATPRCDGDCGRDGVVSVADLVTAVNVALDNAPLASCTSIDLDGGGEVTIDELVLAVGAALEGCTLTVPG
jgi:ELWxxDGT repeat protein